MNGLVETIALNAFGLLNSIYTSYMAPFPAVYTLQYSRVHVHTTNYGNEATYVELLVNKALDFGTALYVSYINPYDGHV